MYALIYNMCTQTPDNWSGELYERHTEFWNNYLNDTVLPSLQKLENISGEGGLLNQLARRSENHGIMNKWLEKFFFYLNRFHVDYNQLPSVKEKGMIKFKTIIFDNVKEPASEMMISLINSEREGSQIDTPVIKSAVKLFEEMGMGSMEVYNEDFETALLTNTRTYYQKKANDWGESMSTPDYLINTEKSIKNEIARVASYLNNATEAKLLTVVTEELLKEKESELLGKEHSGCAALLKNEQHEHLELMFRMFSRVEDGIRPMADIFRDHVTQLGEDVCNNRITRIESQKEKETNDDPQFIKDLISIHDTYLDIIIKLFNNNNLFQKALKDAFTEVINKEIGQYKNADLMSSFCDRLLKGKGNATDDEIDSYLTKVVMLFNYLNDKDLFAEIYRNQLSKRLLTQKSTSEELEKAMMGKLKAKQGNSFTAKMEGMITDLTLGATTSEKFDGQFKAKREDIGLGKMEVSVQCLTDGHWPRHKEFSVNLPPHLLKAKKEYEMFYQNEHQGRRIAWIHSLGSVTLKANFKKGSKNLVITTFQACVLLEFNSCAEGDIISFSDLQERTGLDTDVLKRVIHSLVANKEKVLKKALKSDVKDGAKPDKSIRESDSFLMNEKYESAKKVVNIPMASLDEVNNEKRVKDDRTQAIEASVVRIMKSRKTLAHQQLVMEVMNQLETFKPEGKVVKKIIENLIERDYLERDGTSTYKYLA